MYAQRSAVISSDSTEGHDTDYGELFKEATKIKNKSQRGTEERLKIVVALGKIHSKLTNFTQDDDIGERGARLLKGFYTANKLELQDTLEAHND